MLIYYVKGDNLSKNESNEKNKRGRPKLVHDNREVRRFLLDCQALSNCPSFVDDALNGCAHPEIPGSKKPLSVRSLYNWLRLLDEISTESVMKLTGYSKRYCQHLMICLRVASKHIGFNMLAYKVKLDDRKLEYDDCLCILQVSDCYL